MSERNSGVGDFLRHHKAAEIATGASLAAGAAVAGAAAIIRRRRRRHELHTYPAGLTQSQEVFGYVDDEELAVNLSTKIAGRLYLATTSGEATEIRTAELYAWFPDDEPTRLAVQQSLEELGGHSYIEFEGEYVRATPRLAHAVNDDDGAASAALAQFFYSEANRFEG